MARKSRRTKEERERDLDYITNLTLAGHRQHQILHKVNEKFYKSPESFKLSQQQLAKDMAEIRKRMAIDSLASLREKRALARARYEDFIGQCWAQFEQTGDTDLLELILKALGQMVEFDGLQSTLAQMGVDISKDVSPEQARELLQDRGVLVEIIADRQGQGNA